MADRFLPRLKAPSESICRYTYGARPAPKDQLADYPNATTDEWSHASLITLLSTYFALKFKCKRCKSFVACEGAQGSPDQRHTLSPFHRRHSERESKVLKDKSSLNNGNSMHLVGSYPTAGKANTALSQGLICVKVITSEKQKPILGKCPH